MLAVLADVLVCGVGKSAVGDRGRASSAARAPAQKGPLTAMQIRLTVVDPLGPPPAEARGHAASCDVLVTAPAGTALAAVASALAAAVSGEGASPAASAHGGGPVVLYAGAERLDPRRATLGEPPLIDGAVLSLGAPADAEPRPEVDDAPARLHVVAGPDAGGVHLLHGGEIQVGRSADADVPLDDPDVSRLHCTVTLSADGRVTVADLGSTNGTTLDGTRVGARPVRLAPGALLRVGESALRLAPRGGPGVRVATVPDGEGHVRVPSGSMGAGAGAGTDMGPGTGAGAGAGTGPGPRTGAGTGTGAGPGTGPRPGAGPGTGTGVEDDGPNAAGRAHARVSGTEEPGSGTHGPSGATARAHGAVAWSGSEATRGDTPRGLGEAPSGNPPYGPGAAAPGDRRQGIGDAPRVPDQGAAPHTERHDGAADSRPAGGSGAAPGAVPAGSAGTAPGPADSSDATHGGRSGLGSFAVPDSTRGAHTPSSTRAPHPGPDSHGPHAPSTATTGPTSPYAEAGAPEGSRASAPTAPRGEDGTPGTSRRKGTPVHGTDAPQGVRRRGGLSAWARRLTGARGDAHGTAAHPEHEGEAAASPAQKAAVPARVPETWPDPATLLLTALGPGPRLWERGPGHPEALAVRLGTADRAAPDGSGLLPAVPVTAGLREVGALGLAGPRARLSGLARAVLAQLAALHSPDTLDIVLISTDRSRSAEERTTEWAWLGWLPHVRPAHGQDCRLLLAHDREQATARTDELLRRLEDHLAETDGSRDTAAGGLAPRAPRPARPATPADQDDPRNAPRRPSWALSDDAADPASDGYVGPYTVLVVDGDPGGTDLREAVARLALKGPRAGIHVLCLAETAPASPASPVTETYEAACAAAPVFRECGAIALLGGDVATALHLLRVARAGSDTERPGPVGQGTVGAVDAVSPAWAERFARALAPLRPDGTGGERHTRVSAPLPQSARLLDELGLARATPASLMARWADAADDTRSLGGRAVAVLGAGPRGPVPVDLAADGPHLLIEGPPGSGRTELLRAVVASLAAAERPDRLGIVLLDGRENVGKGGGAHGEGLRVCTDVPHVTTHLTANDPVRMREFAQSLSAELKRRAELLGCVDFAEWHRHHTPSGRVVPQRGPNSGGTGTGSGGTGSGAADLDAPPSSTLRLRPGAAARRRTEAASPLPRLVVIVDDLDALVSPALGSPGRPAAGSVMRALEAVAREGERLGVHLVAAAGPCGRTTDSEPARRATLRITLDPPGSGADEPSPGRGHLTTPEGRSTPFQAGRVTGRIPRTATLRPTVVPLEWQRMGDPPARRPVRELGNGPTDLALLASALERAAREVAAAEVPSLL